MPMNLAIRFAETARRLPQKPAVFDDSGACTYGELLAAAQAVAARVRAATDRRHVAVAAPTSAAFPAAYFGVLLADRAAVPLNFLLDAPTLSFMARDAGFDTVVAARAMERLVQALGAKAVYVEDLGFAAGEGVAADAAAGRADIEPPAEAADAPSAPSAGSGTGGLPGPGVHVPHRGGGDAATILYTSGTEGRPKGVVLSHRNLLRNVEACNEHLALSPDNVFLGVLPFFHAFGLTTSMLLPLLLGCKAVCVARFSPQKVLEAIARHRVTVAFAVSSIYRMLLRAGPPAAGADLASLRLPIAGGEALGADLAAQFERHFGVPILEGYGMTEASPVVSVNVPGRHRPGSVGRPLPWVEPRILDDAGRTLPPGAEGELLLRGECVACGYLNRPDETAAAFAPEGWLRTGDLARLDADGYLWITGRKKDLIISGGENISPAEIEAVLHQHPAVAEAAVIAAPDPARGEVPKALVVLRDGAAASAADLAAFVRCRLPRFKVPAAWEFRASLPHGPTGKVLKRLLREDGGRR
ncbi:MAG: long-chain fatty acid--CoA ligase [Planctomycetes bacterium]|nr:long-chain fatty acid--CoA ligase [Planctomycetota bacterium]